MVDVSYLKFRVILEDDRKSSHQHESVLFFFLVFRFLTVALVVLLPGTHIECVVLHLSRFYPEAG